MKKRLVKFVKDFIHARGVTPQDETLKKHLKWLIETRLLMDACTKEERK